MRVLAIDWGATLGMAWFDDGKYSRHLSVPMDIHVLANYIDCYADDVVVFEIWFPGRYSRRQAGKDTAAYNAMAPRILCDLYGKKSHIVAVSKWQAWAGVYRQDKKKIQEIASKIAGLPVKEHAADAICIGAWYCSEVLKCSQ